MASLFKNPRTVGTLPSLPSIARALFSTLSSQPQTPNPTLPFPSFRAAKSALKSASDPDQLAAIFQNSSESARFRRHRPLFRRSVHRLARLRRPDLVERILEHQKQCQPPHSPLLRSEGFWIRLIMLYSNARLIDQALCTFRQMPDHGCTRTEKSLCAVLSLHFNNGLHHKLRELIQTLPKEIGIAPTAVSYNFVLKSFARENDIDSARAMLRKMENELRIMPDIHSYNILLRAYLESGNEVGFDEIVKEVAHKGLGFNLTSYNYRILRLCKSKECVRAKKLLDEMVAKGVNPDLVSYNMIVDGFCTVGDFESARKVVDRISTDGFVLPNADTYRALINHMVEEGEFEMALELCKEGLKRKKWVPALHIVKGLVEGLVKVSKLQEAKVLVEKMKKRLKGSAADSLGKIEAAIAL